MGMFVFVMALIAVMIFIDEQYSAMNRRLKARARTEDQRNRRVK